MCNGKNKLHYQEKKNFPVINQFIYFQRYKCSQNVSAEQTRSILLRLVLVTNRQPEILMDLSSSGLPEEVKKLVKEKSVFHAKTENVQANYVVEM